MMSVRNSRLNDDDCNFIPRLFHLFDAETENDGIDGTKVAGWKLVKRPKLLCNGKLVNGLPPGEKVYAIAIYDRNKFISDVYPKYMMKGNNNVLSNAFTLFLLKIVI